MARIGAEPLSAPRETNPTRPQRVMMRGANSFPPALLSTTQPSRASLRLRASDNADPPHKGLDLNEVVEKVVHEEKDELPPSDKEATPETSPESPFSPAEENTDDPQAEEQGDSSGIYKESMIQPSKATAASSSIAADASLGVSESSTLATDSPQGGSSGKRDWRVHASAEDAFLGVFGEQGNSVDDYKLRAHIFSESSVFFSEARKQNSSSVV